MRQRINTIVLASMLASLVCAATIVVKIPTPLNGYMNLGDCIVLVAGWFLSPVYAFLAAGIGSALADIFSGYTVYAPATFVIKGLMAVLAGCIFRALKGKVKELPARSISGLLSAVFMVAGYYVFEGFIYGFIPSFANVPANAIQGAAGVLLGLPVAKLFNKRAINLNINK